MDHLRQVLRTLQTEKFYANLKKVYFLYRQGYLFFVCGCAFEGVFADLEKVKAIIECPQPRTIRKVKNFHELATFCHQFIRNFSTIVAPITDCLKNVKFQQASATTKAFREVKKLMTEALVMHLPDFLKVFEVTCDTS